MVIPGPVIVVLVILALMLCVWYIQASLIELEDPDRYKGVPKTRQQWLVRLGGTQAPSIAALLTALMVARFGWEYAVLAWLVVSYFLYRKVDAKRIKRQIERLS